MKKQSFDIPTLSLNEWETLLDEKEKRNKQKKEILELMKKQVEIIDNLRLKYSPSELISEKDQEILEEAMKTYSQLGQQYQSLQIQL